MYLELLNQLQDTASTTRIHTIYAKHREFRYFIHLSSNFVEHGAPKRLIYIPKLSFLFHPLVNQFNNVLIWCSQARHVSYLTCFWNNSFKLKFIVPRW